MPPSDRTLEIYHMSREHGCFSAALNNRSFEIDDIAAEIDLHDQWISTGAVIVYDYVKTLLQETDSLEFQNVEIVAGHNKRSQQQVSMKGMVCRLLEHCFGIQAKEHDWNVGRLVIPSNELFFAKGQVSVLS